MSEIAGAAAIPVVSRTARFRSAAPMAANVALPVGIYYVLVGIGFSSFAGLLWSTVVSALWVIVPAVLRRRFDGLSAFVFAVNALGLGLALLSGSARVMLAKDPIIDVVISALLLASCVFGRPAMFGISRRLHAPGPDSAHSWDALWRNNAHVRRVFMISTLVWTTAFALVAVLRFLVIFTLPVSVAVALTNPVEYAVIGVVFVWSMRNRKRMNINGLLASQ
ncbi:hypothetical protein KO481_29655 [Nocardia sp. NEAU-G5]|uniref:Intracellular septation protein A n=1 Tax=Nocardia albiluteola TaxID=2842303 RepID=A0ABS6B8C8_9NOCA|nr:VC0807 family protein [Nocardia albiluteola]MBU3062485.1 hypothetical protein [Nocardia albiluteola]MBU3065681.1 hypothetical protein [Nocardia albiluteola]